MWMSSLCMRARACTHTCTCIYTYTSPYIHTHLHTHSYNTRVRAHTHTHMHIHMLEKKRNLASTSYVRIADVNHILPLFVFFLYTVAFIRIKSRMF